MAKFRLPAGDQRVTIIGSTGSGKTTCGLWFLAQARFDKRPWVIFDFKREPIFDVIGFPPIEELSLKDKPPRKKGLYLASPLKRDQDAVEDFLWRCFERGNVGVYVDEASLMRDDGAYQAILQQGRTKKIPVISCTQRPVSVPRPVFSEANYYCVYRLADKRDYRVVEGFVPADLRAPLKPFQWRWYQVGTPPPVLIMDPVPPPSVVAEQLRGAIPQPRTWHPFQWTARTTTGRPALKVG